MLSYDHDYIVYLKIADVTEVNRVCDEATEQPEDNKDEIITKTFLSHF